jgi:deoxyribonuclease (pyrimidine dimer)
MTRINLIDPKELSDQHLFAEFREIKMVPKSLARSLKARGVGGVLKTIPAQFTLNAGHVCFFYDKLKYLQERYELLKYELRKRGINFNELSEFDPEQIRFTNSFVFYNNYEPDSIALNIIRERIAEKIALKPQWYRWYRWTESK